jgi:ubiquinone/menaquinone biosynthesis C-methylase UbiE
MKLDAKFDKKVDFGSGYNPEPGYLTCDPFNPMSDIACSAADYKMDAKPETIDVIRCRNVLHHIPDLDRLFDEFGRVLKSEAELIVIEPHPAAFKVNTLLDHLWYRFVNFRPEIWITPEYRDYTAIAEKHGFRLVRTVQQDEKETNTYRRIA